MGEENLNGNRSGLDVEELRKRLTEEDNFIVRLINTIPPKMYFDQEVHEKITAEKHAAMDDATRGLKRSYSGQQEITSKIKHKLARLDPLQHKSVSQIQQELEQDEKQKSKKGSRFLSESLARAASIEELQKRIQQRIKELQAKRRGCSEEEFLEKKRLKNKMKKIKSKQKGNKIKSAVHERTQTPSQQKSPKDVKPKLIYNKDGKIIYSKFDFAEVGEKEYSKEKKKSTKNFKKLLQHAEKEKEKLETLKQEDREKAAFVEQKNLWQRAIQKAEGVKVKDDPSLLKKTLKKQEKKKKRSAKEWQKRKEDVEKKKKAKQEKRKKNIQAKKQEKISKKIKRAKKKGRIIPGF